MRKIGTTRVMAIGAALFLMVACSGDAEESSPAQDAQTETSSPAPAEETDMTIAEIVGQENEFSTLLTAVEAAELGETLSGEGPYTVFAPTDEAFAALPEQTLNSLLQPRNQDELASILTYHVVPGEVKSADVTSGEAATANGEPFTISVDEGTVTITDGAGNEATVTATDIEASNGVIHVIDSVLLPPQAA
jgi:uncharacterized surface protein with fasciclin (FAS1) repeats